MTEVATATNPFAEYFDTSEIDDGTSIVSADGAARIKARAENMLATLKTAAGLASKLGKANKTIAWDAILMALDVRDPAGYPILSMETGKASEYVKRFLSYAYDRSFPIPTGESVSESQKSEARKARSNSLTTVRLYWGGRKGVGGMREIVATQYVIDNIDSYNLTPEQTKSLLKPGFLKWSDGDPDIKWDDGSEATYLKQVPAFLKKPIGDVYRHSGLDVPEKFGGQPKDGNSQGTKDKKLSPEQFTTTVTENVTHLTAVTANASLFAGDKAMVRALLDAKGGNIDERGTFVEITEQRISVLTLLLKHAQGKITDKERENLDALVAIPDLMEVVKGLVAETTGEKVAA